ncbi:alpha/beta fold hydrolase [Pseudorhodoferax sp.]|uniref:alpha/beta fold hydrolase n=1 Tax=Pseudorhodoferax sp. TaxID=1993553 RepID=UPI0039E26449
MTPQDHWIATPAGRLFARSWQPAAAGAAAPLLLQHDSLGCVELWRDFPAALAGATGRRVLAYDRLGFGRSDPRAGALPPDFVAREAREQVPLVLQALAVDRFVALGHSVGGGMSVETAAAHPARCTALVTISAQAFAEDRTLAGVRAAREVFRQPDQLDRLARYHGAKARWVLDAWTETWLSPAFAGWTLDAALARLGCPVLAIHGDRDEYGSTAHPQRIAARAAGPVQQLVVEGGGHLPHREQPERVLAAVARFLAGPRISTC